MQMVQITLKKSPRCIFSDFCHLVVLVRITQTDKDTSDLLKYASWWILTADKAITDMPHRDDTHPSWITSNYSWSTIHEWRRVVVCHSWIPGYIPNYSFYLSRINAYIRTKHIAMRLTFKCKESSTVCQPAKSACSICKFYPITHKLFKPPPGSRTNSGSNVIEFIKQIIFVASL